MTPMLDILIAILTDPGFATGYLGAMREHLIELLATLTR